MRPVRMRLFPDQEATIAEWIDLAHLEETGELVFSNLIIEKSRQIGETWLFAAVLVWLLLFHPSLVGGALHTVGAEIDDGGERNTVKSLFGKVRYIVRRLPEGAAPGWRDGGYPLRFWPLSNQGPAKVENQANGAVVYGEGQKDDPFRGSTLDYVLVDEAARVRHGEQVHAAIDDACPTGKAYLSTPYGDENVHARLADERPAGYRYLRLHWSTHPVYSKGVHVAALVDRDTARSSSRAARAATCAPARWPGSSGRAGSRARTATPARSPRPGTSSGSSARPTSRSPPSSTSTVKAPSRRASTPSSSRPSTSSPPGSRTTRWSTSSSPGTSASTAPA
jgi:hypothetical protein